MRSLPSGGGGSRSRGETRNDSAGRRGGGSNGSSRPGGDDDMDGVPYASGEALPPAPSASSGHLPRHEQLFGPGPRTLTGALDRARLQAVAWRTQGRRAAWLRLCWRGWLQQVYAARMQWAAEAAKAEANAARVAEMDELHAANARIATLAFMQATAPAPSARLRARPRARPRALHCSPR